MKDTDDIKVLCQDARAEFENDILHATREYPAFWIGTGVVDKKTDEIELFLFTNRINGMVIRQIVGEVCNVFILFTSPEYEDKNPIVLKDVEIRKWDGKVTRSH